MRMSLTGRAARPCAIAAVAAAVLAVAGTGSAAAQPGGGNSTFGRSHRAVCGAVGLGHARCNSEVVTDAAGDPVATVTPSGFGPADLQSAYALATLSSGQGAGKTIAIVDAFDDPNAESDLGTYRSQYGLTACTTANGCFKKVNQSGGTSYPTANKGWAEEISLDLDMASAICPKCNIVLVESTDNSFLNLATAVDQAAAQGANAISNSYGGNEYSSETTDESHYDHPGIAVTVSSGDSGYGAEFPATSQYVTAVGGTHLVKNTSTRGWGETTWSSAGSGCSAYVGKPAWQTDSGCANRTEADVSAVADPNTGVAVYDTYGGDPGWMVFGGTSAASPIVAAFDVLVGATSPQYPYSHTSSYFDVTSGANKSNCGSTDYLCRALAGYDGPTGWGSPNGGSPAATAPTATTGSASGIDDTGATLNGQVNPNGSSTTYHFDWGQTTSYTSGPTSTSSPLTGSTSQPATATISGLSPNTTYHFRVVASSSGGTTNGSDQSFTTTGPPTATTGAASGVTTSGATLNGTYNPDGHATTYHFIWGTTTSYTGTPTPESSPAVGGTSNQSASAAITGLQPSTTYHYKVVATNGSGSTTASNDQSFTTAAVSNGTGTGGSGGGGTGGGGGSTGGSSGSTTTTTTTTSTTTTATTTVSTASVATTLPGVSGVVTPPQVSVAAAAQKLGTVLKKGFKASARCASTCSIAGSLVLPSRTAKRLHIAAASNVTVARGSASLSHAGSATVTLKFTTRARKALAKLRSVTLTLRVVGANTAGSGPAVSRTVKLRR
jgi:hypothetical protein